MATSTLQRIGRSSNSGWDVYSLGLQAVADMPSEISLPSNNFVCFLSWNAARAEASEIAVVAEKLLSLGCVYFCCRGADCERVHDIIDEVLVGDRSTNVAWLDVMTTWHDKDSLDDAIAFFLDSACPTDRYLNDCRTALAVTIGVEYEVVSIELALAMKLREPPSNPPLKGTCRKAARP
jgi:hypothetical protein